MDMTEKVLQDLEECSQMFDFSGFLPAEDKALLAEVRRLRQALETVECQLDCWLDLPTGTRRSHLLEFVRAALEATNE